MPPDFWSPASWINLSFWVHLSSDFTYPRPTVVATFCPLLQYVSFFFPSFSPPPQPLSSLIIMANRAMPLVLFPSFNVLQLWHTKRGRGKERKFDKLFFLKKKIFLWRIKFWSRHSFPPPSTKRQTPILFACSYSPLLPPKDSLEKLCMSLVQKNVLPVALLYYCTVTYLDIKRKTLLYRSTVKFT